MLFVLSVFGTIFGFRIASQSQSKAPAFGLPKFTLEQLKPFDGSDPNKPIYLVLDGLVYDVTSGKEFYQTGAPYHYLVGKDSSALLHLVGGSTIKRKYKVVGTLSS